MPTGEEIYDKLLKQGFTKVEIHTAIYEFIMSEIEQKKAYKKLSVFGKIKWHLRNRLVQLNHFLKRFSGRRES